MTDRTEYRVDQVLARTKTLRRRRERQLIGALTTVCLLLTAGLAGVLAGTSGGLPSSLPVTEAFAAVLLHENAGGYVLVGVLAFAAGTAITALCIWRRNKHRRGG